MFTYLIIARLFEKINSKILKGYSKWHSVIWPYSWRYTVRWWIKSGTKYSIKHLQSFTKKCLLWKFTCGLKMTVCQKRDVGHEGNLQDETENYFSTSVKKKKREGIKSWCHSACLNSGKWKCVSCQGSMKKMVCLK